jgi:hypothetical protein
MGQMRANGRSGVGASLPDRMGSALVKGLAKNKNKETGMFQGHIDMDGAVPVGASAMSDVLFERGLYWASGRSGVVNLVAATSGSTSRR